MPSIHEFDGIFFCAPIGLPKADFLYVVFASKQTPCSSKIYLIETELILLERHDNQVIVNKFN